jgi:hypothetical protein
MKTTQNTSISATEFAKQFVVSCESAGWQVVVKEGNVVTLHKNFRAESNQEYISADMEGEQLIRLLPQSGGSIWGTLSNGVGGYAALKSGRYVINASEVRAAVCKAIAKELATS